MLEQISQDCSLGACILREEQMICLGARPSHELGRENRKRIFCFPSELSMLWQAAQAVFWLAQINFIGNKPENML